MFDAHDANRIGFLEIEEHPVVAAAEPEAGARRLELFPVAVAVGQVAARAVEKLHRGFAVDAPQIRAGFRRPDDRDPFRGGILAH